jgi:hypothetical protein
MARATSTSTVAASSTRPPPRLRDDRADHAVVRGEPGCPTARVAEVFSDGICLHTESGVWSPGLDRRQARLPARPGGGEVLRWTETDHACVGCMLGGQDGRRCHAGHRLEHGQRLRGELAAADHRGLAPANYTPPPRGCPVPAGPRADLVTRPSSLCDPRRFGGSRRRSRRRTEKFIRAREGADENVSAVPIDRSIARIASRCERPGSPAVDRVGDRHGRATGRDTSDRSEPAHTALGLPTRSALLDPPVSVDQHVMARRREESG